MKVALKNMGFDFTGVRFLDEVGVNSSVFKIDVAKPEVIICMIDHGHQVRRGIICRRRVQIFEHAIICGAQGNKGYLSDF